VLSDIICYTAAPRKTAEGLGKAQKGTGERPQVGLETIATQQALSTYSFMICFVFVKLISCVVIDVEKRLNTENEVVNGVGARLVLFVYFSGV
jgi:hypothetical protein